MCRMAGKRDGHPSPDGESHRNQKGLFRSSSPTAIHTSEKRGPDRLPTKVDQDHAAGTSHWCVHGKQRLRRPCIPSENLVHEWKPTSTGCMEYIDAHTMLEDAPGEFFPFAEQ
ncbi:hypothetical protein N7532_002420 [Penicillium argentinense]|uniref:Uncharacterized protein n=1 Tax=Penicillium argentinense TaxID=1131581 RepID=A0A9W9G1A4_9EURO|nr:uncharacterized protein N7532_002420 [Penicillium argentinense]KAJ5109775.1 hypothetical protein N7532_002420 [Penicillium argentinense]